MTKSSIAVLLGSFVFCVGCGPAPVEKAEDSRSLSELAQSAMAQSKELKFLLSEEAGSESYADCVDQIKVTLNAMSDSLATAGSEQAGAKPLADAVEAAKAAHDSLASAAKSSSSAAQISKANLKFHKKLKAISKLSE